MPSYPYQKETIEEIRKVPNGTVAREAADMGCSKCEPLLVAMDAMLRYAKAYSGRYETLLGSDGFLDDPYKQVIKGIRALLNGDGAVAMERGITTDSKDNGAIEALYWHCCREAGIDGNE